MSKIKSRENFTLFYSTTYIHNLYIQTNYVLFY
nr:MAG TPA: hypothetical protein [Caudoviricetes sp.]